MAVTAYQQDDLVWLDLGGRRTDVLLSLHDADGWWRELKRLAVLARECPYKSLYKGEPWGLQVQPYDERIAIRFHPPTVGAPDRVPLTADAADRLADLIRDKMVEAEHGIRFVFKNVG